MAYHTVLYLSLFLPALLLLYQLAPRRYRWAVLLGGSYGFSYLICGWLTLYLAGTAVLVHYLGIWMELLRYSRQDGEKGQERNRKKQEKRILLLGVGILLAILLSRKYYAFLGQNLNVLLEALGQLPLFPPKDLLLPIGISFYTLMAVGYLADVYWGRIPAERHLGYLALYLGYFPQIMEGPICRYSDTAAQLRQGGDLTGENLAAGGIRIFWGLFKKIVIADRLNVLAGELFGTETSYSGALILAAAAAYTIQLYMEFSGCMDLVLGSSRMFGIALPENFRQPFAARTVADFWRRWHITLGVWLKTYIFYPASTSCLAKKWNRFGKEHLTLYWTQLGMAAIALFPVWMINGLWHGPRWSYVFYGMYYFTLIFLGIAVEPLRMKLLMVLGLKEGAWYYRYLQHLKMWVIILTGELFFRAEGLAQGMKMFARLFVDFDLSKLWDGSLLNLGLGKGDFCVVFLGCLVVAFVGHGRERGVLSFKKLQGFPLPFRWSLYYGLILSVILLGAYGEGYQVVDLIYAGF
ncbi:MAG: MBOAT family protein [Lachnospiraceae bacterium]|nr:MBOAT family protein [Lachnospiraceae bacterium]